MASPDWTAARPSSRRASRPRRADSVVPWPPTRLVLVSKYLARHIRHDPGRIGLALDDAGWAHVDDLLRSAAAHRFPISRRELMAVVRFNKARYELDPSGTRIRARQGHSIDVDLGLEPATPPAILYHGTATRFLDAILAEGLRPMNRQRMHLSIDVPTASAVGRRHGRPVVLAVDAARLHAAGVELYLSANGVWLAPAIPAERLEVDAASSPARN